VSELHQILYGAFTPPVTTRTYTHLINDEPRGADREERAKAKAVFAALKQEHFAANKARLIAMGLATRKKIFETLRDRPNKSISEIMVAVEMGRSATQKHIQALIKEQSIGKRKRSISGGGYEFEYFIIN
jgi:DNA-binding transcriptional ArsR family regulator